MRIRFIVNPSAGAGSCTRSVTEAVKTVLAPAEGVFEIRSPKSAHGMELMSREARDQGYDMVFACGGDGTVNRVAAPLVESTVTLGVLPIGSGNGFARSLGVPTDLKDALELVRYGRVRRVDVGHACERYFLSTAGVALDAEVARAYNSRPRSSKRGMLPYFSTAFNEFRAYRPEEMVIKFDNSAETVRPLILTVANTTHYGGGAVIAPGALPDDGLLDVCLVPPMDLGRGVNFAVKLLTGSVEKFRGYRTFRTHGLEVLRTRSDVVQLDGDTLRWGGSILFRVVPSSLNVLVK